MYLISTSYFFLNNLPIREEVFAPCAPLSSVPGMLGNFLIKYVVELFFSGNWKLHRRASHAGGS